MSRPDPSRPADGTAPPIAIIGMGALFPNARGLKEYWRLIQRREDAIREVPPTHWPLDDYFDADPKAPDKTYCRRGGFLEPTAFDPVEFGIPPTTLEATDTAQLLGLIVGKQALHDAGYGPQREFDRTRASVILGVTGTQELVIPLGARLGHPQWRRALQDAGVAPEVAGRVLGQLSDSYVGWQENSFPGLLGNVVAGRIANRLNLRGTNCVVDAACASSLSAMHLATLELANGRCDLALTGGVDTLNDIFMFMCFSKTQALSPSGDARPFDHESDGTVIGEGVGMLVLKRLADARRDGDRVYAVLRGIGTSSDGRSQSIYAPRAEGQALALRNAYRIADVSPTTVELVEAHGTGTKVGDVVEFDALQAVYREANPVGQWCALGSVKSQIGHTKAAAGAASLVKAVLALHQRVLPATIKVSQPNPKLEIEQSPFYLATAPRPWFESPEHPRRAAVSSFGFGGSNFHAVLEEYPQPHREPGWDGSVQIIALSADTPAALHEALANWRQFAAVPSLDRDELARRSAAARTTFDPQQPYRLALVYEYGQSLASLVALASRSLDAQGTGQAWSVGNVFFGGPAAPGELAFLFPGQGSQYVNMGRDIVCCFPEAHDVFAPAADASPADAAHLRALRARIFPLPARDEQAQEAALTDTACAQPAIGAVSLALLRVLARFGIRPHVVAGHSFGELTALHAAGCLRDEDFRSLARTRGALMATADDGQGAMLAVHAPLDELAAVIAAEGLDVVLANRNGPTQGILSGSRSAIDRARQFLENQKGWRTRLLKVSAAFHTRVMETAERGFRAALDKVPVTSGMCTVFANVTGRPYTPDPDEMRDLLARQLTHPVQFFEEIRNLYDRGVRTFVEVGPKNVLTGLVQTVLSGLPHQAIAMDGSCGRSSGIVDVARVVALLAILGHTVDLTNWETAPPERVAQSMSIALLGTNYRAPLPATALSTPAVAGAASPRTPDGMPTMPTKPVPNGSTEPAHANPMVTPWAAGPPAAGPPPEPDSAQLLSAVDLVREGLQTMQRLQQQTAGAHQKFLESQERAHATIQRVIENHQRILERTLGLSIDGVPAIALAESPATLPTLERAALETVADRRAAAPAWASADVPTPIPIAEPPADIPPAPAPATPPTPPASPPSDAKPAVADPLRPTSTGSATTDNRIDPTRFATDLLEVVAELTGYPVEMLDVNMDIEADLGIDSIKRLEILSAVQRRCPAAKAVDSQYLGSLRTLQNIIDYMAAPAVAAEPARAAPEAPLAPPAHTAPAQLTAPPAPIERLELHTIELPPVEAGSFGFAPQREVWIIAAAPDELTEALLAEFAARGVTARLAVEPPPSADLQRVGGLLVVAPTAFSSASAGATFLKRVFQWTQAVAPHLERAADEGSALFATVAHLDGAFGLSGAVRDALPGGLAGLVKTAADEWPRVNCVALDIDPQGLTEAQAARAIIAELSADGPIEVGLSLTGRVGLGLRPTPARPGGLTLRPTDVVVVTGGARGVTADCAIALARCCPARFLILGRSPTPHAEPGWSANVSDEAQLKQVLRANLPNGDRLKPAELEREYRRLRANREISETLAALRATGSHAEYHAIDVRSAEAVGAALAAARRSGTIRGVIHGAGVIEDHRIEDKQLEQFERVFDTKVAGLDALLSATAEDDLRFIALFSSVSGRFGRRGQADYAMANEVLNKTAQRLARARPACRVVALNWGPWDGGMVTAPLKREFERAGVRLIGRASGAAAFVAELTHPDRVAVEVVLGAPLASHAPRRRPHVAPSAELAHLAPPLAAEMTIGFERHVDPQENRFLLDHMIAGHPVLPVVMMLEWLGHAALHANPGLHLCGFDEFRVLKGLVLSNGSRDVHAYAGRPRRQAGHFIVEVELRSGPPQHEYVHAHARAILAAAFDAPPPTSLAAKGTLSPGRLYGPVLFHGPAFQGLTQLYRLGNDELLADVRVAPPPAEWMRDPPRSAWLTDPLALDAALQLGLVRCHDHGGSLGLPSHIRAYRQYAAEFPRDGLHALLQARSLDAGLLCGDLRLTDPAGRTVAELLGVEWVINPNLRADPENRFSAARA